MNNVGLLLARPAVFNKPWLPKTNVNVSAYDSYQGVLVSPFKMAPACAAFHVLPITSSFRVSILLGTNVPAAQQEFQTGCHKVPKTLKAKAHQQFHSLEPPAANKQQCPSPNANAPSKPSTSPSPPPSVQPTVTTSTAGSSPSPPPFPAPATFQHLSTHLPHSGRSMK